MKSEYQKAIDDAMQHDATGYRRNLERELATSHSQYKAAVRANVIRSKEAENWRTLCEFANAERAKLQTWRGFLAFKAEGLARWIRECFE